MALDWGETGSLGDFVLEGDGEFADERQRGCSAEIKAPILPPTLLFHLVPQFPHQSRGRRGWVCKPFTCACDTLTQGYTCSCVPGVSCAFCSHPRP